MIPPDQEIFEVESRIAARRAQFARHSREARGRALQALASPAALGAAALLGFLVAGGLVRREKKPPHPERRKSDHLKAAKATGLVGALTTATMWFIRAQYGSPVQAAQTLLHKFQKRKQAASPRPDIVRP
jgi:hypothetical protein